MDGEYIEIREEEEIKMANLNSLLAAITMEDILEIMPSGLVSGTALWIRLGGPISKNVWMDKMRSRPDKNTRARSGWMCGAALIIKANSTKKDEKRETTAKMTAHLEVFEGFLEDYAACIVGKGNRTAIVVKKHKDKQYSVSVPTRLVNSELQKWCSTPWPDSEAVIELGFDP